MSEEKQMTPLQEVIEKLKHDIEYFTPPHTEFQAGRRNQSASLLTFAQSLLPKEKQMVVDAFSDGFANVITAEHYFNKTYNQ